MIPQMRDYFLPGGLARHNKFCLVTGDRAAHRRCICIGWNRDNTDAPVQQHGGNQANQGEYRFHSDVTLSALAEKVLIDKTAPTSLHSMNVHHLELFYYVAKHGGIMPAVRNIPYGIQQPAVSAQVAQLEEFL